jgi:N6-L-threonylcarbamoyladenine synthase
MNILGIETSCDETAVSVVKAEGGTEQPRFSVLGNALYSQVKVHEKYGGVFPALAKREHSKNLVPLFKKALSDAGLLSIQEKKISAEKSGERESLKEKLRIILEREPELSEQFLSSMLNIQKPNIDAIAVTQGPGLEPALWVGINFAKALSALWDIPIIPTNHMEGHIYSVLATGKSSIVFPALALLISGGHTELVLMKDWQQFQVIGQTRDDAVGEAFDKVARMMGLPYPGGPEISRLAAEQRAIGKSTGMFKLPRPMLRSEDYDFSFSGLKTSVLYSLRRLPEISNEARKEMAEEFENAVTEVLLEKTRKSLEEFGVKTLIIGGGVVANVYIKESFVKMMASYPDIGLLLPENELSTDNAVMIAIAGYIKKQFNNLRSIKNIPIVANGNLKYS